MERLFLTIEIHNHENTYDIRYSVSKQCFRRMSNIANYDEISESHDFVMKHNDACILNFYRKNLKVYVTTI